MIKNYIPSYRNSLEYQIEAVSYAMSIEFGDTLKEGTVWVPDGIRINNSWGHRNCLDNIFETLVDFHLSNKNNLVYLSGNYLDRFNQSVSAIENCFKIKR
jgi:nicotinamide riboside kinase